LIIQEQKFLAIKFEDGTYRKLKYTRNLPETDIARIVKYFDREDAEDAANDLNKHGRKCTIVPVKIVMFEVEQSSDEKEES